MTLSEYLETNVLIANTHGIFSYDVFKKRLITRWGKRKILDGNISEIAQNAIDVEKSYYQGLFSENISPLKTWSETSVTNNSEDGTNEQTSEKSNTLLRTGTITNKGENEVISDGSSKNSGTNNATSTNNVWAYNSTSSLPESSQNNSSSQNGEGSYNDNSTTTNDNTETLDTQDQASENGTLNVKTSRNGTSNVERYGYNLTDAINVINTRFAAYDILINDIAPLILDFYDFHL